MVAFFADDAGVNVQQQKKCRTTLLHQLIVMVSFLQRLSDCPRHSNALVHQWSVSTQSVSERSRFKSPSINNLLNMTFTWLCETYGVMCPAHTVRAPEIFCDILHTLIHLCSACEPLMLISLVMYPPKITPKADIQIVVAHDCVGHK